LLRIHPSVEDCTYFIPRLKHSFEIWAFLDTSLDDSDGRISKLRDDINKVCICKLFPCCSPFIRPTEIRDLQLAKLLRIL
jgi:hypothetical protein